MVKILVRKEKLIPLKFKKNKDKTSNKHNKQQPHELIIEALK